MNWSYLERKAHEALKRNAARINDTKQGTAGQKPPEKRKPGKKRFGGRMS